jgi:hypothetical protein
LRNPRPRGVIQYVLIHAVIQWDAHLFHLMKSDDRCPDRIASVLQYIGRNSGSTMVRYRLSTGIHHWSRSIIHTVQYISSPTVDHSEIVWAHRVRTRTVYWVLQHWYRLDSHQKKPRDKNQQTMDGILTPCICLYDWWNCIGIFTYDDHTILSVAGQGQDGLQDAWLQKFHWWSSCRNGRKCTAQRSRPCTYCTAQVAVFWRSMMDAWMGRPRRGS